MKKVNIFGKIIIAIGVLSVFRKEDGFYGFGGYVDSTWVIIIISLVLVLTGITLIFISKKDIGKRRKK